MNIADLIVKITTGGCGALLIILTIIQIAPIKINPWSYIANKIGKAINGEVIEKVDKISIDVNNLRNECNEREANLCRTHILHFNDEILHDIRHTKEHFDQILIDISTYETYCDLHPNYKNNIANDAISRIKRTYQKCGDDGTFL